MQIRTLNREEAKSILDKYAALNSIPDSVYDQLDNNYNIIREDLLKMYDVSKREARCKEYHTDLFFAVRLFEYFNKAFYFNETIANNLEFWSYLCVNVVPDIVFDRFKTFNKDRYYNKSGRVYLQSLWLYIFVSFNGDLMSTKEMLQNLNTDYIMNITERTGRHGFYVEVYREIMKTICMLPTEVINKKYGDKNLFRRVMIQNTAKSEIYNLVIEGDAKTYVRNLFNSCKVRVEDYEQ